MIWSMTLLVDHGEVIYTTYSGDRGFLFKATTSIAEGPRFYLRVDQNRSVFAEKQAFEIFVAPRVVSRLVI